MLRLSFFEEFRCFVCEEPLPGGYYCDVTLNTSSHCTDCETLVFACAGMQAMPWYLAVCGTSRCALLEGAQECTCQYARHLAVPVWGRYGKYLKYVNRLAVLVGGRKKKYLPVCETSRCGCGGGAQRKVSASIRNISLSLLEGAQRTFPGIHFVPESKSIDSLIQFKQHLLEGGGFIKGSLVDCRLYL